MATGNPQGGSARTLFLSDIHPGSRHARMRLVHIRGNGPAGQPAFEAA